MPYTHTSFGQLKAQLALRLGDPSKVFWVDAELGIWITEAIRTFGLLSGFWRERGVLTAMPRRAFYDIFADLQSGDERILAPSVTDHDIIQTIQYALLESTASQSSWTGTAQFTYADIANAVQNRTNQFLLDTGQVLTRSLMAVASPPIGRQPLAQDVIDVRRAVFIGAPPFAYATILWRTDEYELTAADQRWSVDAATPLAFAVMSPPPLQLQLAPPPLASGILELLAVRAVALDPAATATVLPMPDDWTPAVKWGALADLLSIDGQARDLPRAAYCELRYQQLAALARLTPTVLHAELNGLPLIPTSLYELDTAEPNWENEVGVPETIATPGSNILALHPIPDGLYSVTLDVVRRAPVPMIDADTIPVGREQLDAIVDYAEHLALFKSAGAEFMATEKQASNFLRQAVGYNQRIAAQARYVFTARDHSQKEASQRLRRHPGVGLGAAPSEVPGA
ncbi:MAG TPA: hypothetical protein VFC19_22470 [Candidatus Limnocylindrales bacterium]|nr:hypothetical protein [Candidatus Limnocylindrales bacterium]